MSKWTVSFNVLDWFPLLHVLCTVLQHKERMFSNLDKPIAWIQTRFFVNTTLIRIVYDTNDNAEYMDLSRFQFCIVSSGGGLLAITTCSSCCQLRLQFLRWRLNPDSYFA